LAIKPSVLALLSLMKQDNLELLQQFHECLLGVRQFINNRKGTEWVIITSFSKENQVELLFYEILNLSNFAQVSSQIFGPNFSLAAKPFECFGS